jgi:CheY-like chemotaxis protein
MKHTILTIDDHGDTRRLIRMTLEYKGFTALEAENGPHGLEMARTHHPDLILLDVMMPGMDGLSVAEQLIADPVLGRIPVVMLSALAGQNNIDAGLHAGARTYLVKPFSPLALIDVIRRLLEDTAACASAAKD